MAKKRKDTAPSATLLDFFGRPERVVTVKKPRLSPITPSGTARKHAFAPEDIIVIDDSDDERGPSGTREHVQRENLASGSKAQTDSAVICPATIVSARSVDSGDITVIGDSGDESLVSTSRIPLDNSAPRPQDATLDAGGSVNDPDALPDRRPDQSLEQPTLPHVNSTVCEKSEHMGFGQPVLLMDSEEQRSAPSSEPTAMLGEVSCPSPQAGQEPISTIEPRVEAPDYEWHTGDDEMAVVSIEEILPSDGEGAPESQQPDISDENTIEQCPICALILLDMSLVVRH
ncbi:hypothetical protein BDY19DRAFT_628318 [Irpex rosettiformis]|uniref:Uncharacterized protein n=1 Tax=Irpex rosettiformis TaxID=378272 RepID=A0ACB8UB33_9APHY|nr:hypothetical protein BDY19DRAFT_628318 [Irpex rosettiformis]